MVDRSTPVGSTPSLVSPDFELAMGRKLDQLIQFVRDDKGPFFMARLCLRLDFDLNPGAVEDSDERQRAFVEACKGLGYELNPERIFKRRPA